MRRYSFKLRVLRWAHLLHKSFLLSIINQKVWLTKTLQITLITLNFVVTMTHFGCTHEPVHKILFFLNFTEATEAISPVLLCFSTVASSCFATLSQCIVINTYQLTEAPPYTWTNVRSHRRAQLFNMRRNYAPELTAVIKASKAGCKIRLRLCCSSPRSVLKFSALNSPLNFPGADISKAPTWNIFKHNHFIVGSMLRWIFIPHINQKMDLEL